MILGSVVLNSAWCEEWMQAGPPSKTGPSYGWPKLEEIEKILVDSCRTCGTLNEDGCGWSIDSPDKPPIVASALLLSFLRSDEPFVCTMYAPHLGVAVPTRRAHIRINCARPCILEAYRLTTSQSTSAWRRSSPAWEIGRKMKIKNIGVHGDEYRSKEFSNLHHFPCKPPLSGVKME
jgi:hypothetical protein